MDLLKILDFTALFGGLSEDSKKCLAEIGIPKNVAKNETLFGEGEKGYALYICAKGKIQLTKEGADLQDIVVRIIQPGEVFGEVILFEQDTYPVTATALTDSIVFILPKKQFHDLLNKVSFRNDFIVFLMNKLRYLTKRMTQMQAHEVDQRFILYLKENYPKSNRIIPGMSKKDMAAAIGTTPETLSRVLLKFKKENVLVWEGKEIICKEGFWKS